MADKASDSKTSPAPQSADLPETLSFEEAMADLEGIVQEMAGGNLPLEKLVSSHERAVRLLGHCQRRLDEAKERIRIIDESGAGVALRPFNSGTVPSEDEESSVNLPIQL